MTEELVLPRVLQARAERDPEGVLVEEVGGRTLTNQEFQELVRRWADALTGVDVEPGALVATMLPTSLESYLCWMGLGWLRAPEVPLNTDLRGNSLCHALNDSRAEVIVVAERFVDRLAAVADRLEHLRVVVIPDRSEAAPALPWRTLGGAEFFAESRPAVRRTPAYHDIHAVIYTSGTTGPSKGVLQPWGAIQSMPEGIFPGEVSGATEDGAIFSCWPTFHTSGRFGLCIAGRFDWRLVLRRSFSLSEFWADVAAHRITHTALLVVAPLLLRRPEAAGDAENCLQRVAMYPLIPQYREFERRFGVRISAGYGLSEAGFAIVTDDPPNHRSVGRPRPGWQVRVVNELDEPVGPDTLGEIVLRSDLPWRMSSGYLRRPDATAASWRNGWFHTGDAGTHDIDGNFYFVDRLTDSLRHRGHNVSSMEVEGEVLAHPLVAECACIGVPSDLAHADDAVKDDDIKIFVVPSSATLTEDELLEFLIPRMPRFMLPRYIELVAHLPKTSTNKVRKVELPTGPSGWDREAAGIRIPR